MDTVVEEFAQGCPILHQYIITKDLSHLDEKTLCYAQEVIWLEVASFLRHKLVPRFWSYFQQDNTDEIRKKYLQLYDEEKTTRECENEICYQEFRQFAEAVRGLNAYYQIILNTLLKMAAVTCSTEEKSPVDVEDRLKMKLRVALLAQFPANFQNMINSFYYISLRTFFSIQAENEILDNSDEDGMSEDSSACKGCQQSANICKCQEILSTMDDINQKLVQMKLLDRLAGQRITALVQKRIDEHIQATCKGVFDKSHIEELLKWLDNIVITWLIRIFGTNAPSDNEASECILNNNVIHGLKIKLTFAIYESYASTIIEQFFAIIIDFPDSIPAIEDLKVCMDKINLRKHIITSLRSCLQGRILHPGVNTMDILTSYVSAIKAIRYLDSSGVILETVTAPIKDYLRQRNDTVRCVVTSLTEEGPTDLSEELAKAEHIREQGTGVPGTEEIEADWEKWQPEPVGLEPSTQPRPTKAVRSADIISMIVDIYGSKELFMNEYRNLLAERLLNLLEFNPEKEIRNLELLKLRFGEPLLHKCGVMLKDVADSKRINGHILSDANYIKDKKFDMAALIISSEFWPAFNKESVELPAELMEQFAKFTKSYEAYKGNRTLNWRTITGRVDISIEINNRVLDMSVPPTQLVIIYHFQKKTEWELDDLSAITQIPPSILRRRMTFWQNHGLISEIQSGVYKLNEGDLSHKTSINTVPIAEIADDDEQETAMASANDQREQELQVFWSYIVGMLTNLDSMPIERIHQMLKLFASNGVGIEFTQDDLKDFLQRKVRDHKLLYSNGVYQLAK